MKSKPFDPLRLDVEAFARAGARLEGSWPLQAFPRLMQGDHVGVHPAPLEGSPMGAGDMAAPSPVERLVTWSAQGRTVQRVGVRDQVWIDLQAAATVSLECQRCLQPVATPLQLERSFRFMPDEQQAAELDSESDHEVLALSRSLDLRELIEDELILDLPLVPRHEVCPTPLAAPADADAPGSEGDEAEARPNPFAALAALKRSPKT